MVPTKGVRNINRSNIGSFKKEEVTEEPKKPKDVNVEDVLNTKLKHDNNLYLQILSCLSKIDKDNSSKTEIQQKLKESLKDQKIEINDKKLMKIITIDDEELGSNKKDKNFIEEVKKIIDAEMSEEEHAEKTNYRFVRPPHSPEEMKKTLEQAEKIYEENKPFLFINDKDINIKYEDIFRKKIPKFFTMRKLRYPPTNTDILLCGVRRNSNIHAVFLNKVLEKIDPDAIMLQMPPDIPLFIENVATDDYELSNLSL